MKTFKRLSKYGFILFFLYASINISLEAFQVFYYEADRELQLALSKQQARETLAAYPQLGYEQTLEKKQLNQILFSAMLLERTPEGLSQLEMLYHAHDYPLILESSELFPDAMSLETLYQNYQERLKNIGENAKIVERKEITGDIAQFEGEVIHDILVISDFQMRDEESPFLLYPLKPYFPTSYYPANPHVPYIVNDSLKTLKHFLEKEKKEIDLAVYTGDITDNGHYNEVRWGIDVMDGNTVHPDSGEDDDIFPGLFPDGEANDTADAFDAEGLGNIPWYFVPGNHDGLAMGVFHMTYTPLDLWITELKNGTYHFMNDISLGDTNYMGNIPNIRSMIRYWWSEKPWLKVAADPERRLLNPYEVALEMFNSTGQPQGHGMHLVKDIKNERSYSFHYHKPGKNWLIRHIALDTNTNHPQGEYGEDNLQWLEAQLKQAEMEGALVVVSSHHTPADIFENGGDLIRLLNQYPNVIAHLVAHRHKNAIRLRNGATEAQSYWEIESGSMVNWPQQVRLLSVKVDENQGVGVIESTMLNHHNPNPVSVSERGRFLAYLEAWFHGGDEKLSQREGQAEERNVKLYFRLPPRAFAQATTQEEN